MLSGPELDGRAAPDRRNRGFRAALATRYGLVAADSLQCQRSESSRREALNSTLTFPGSSAVTAFCSSWIKFCMNRGMLEKLWHICSLVRANTCQLSPVYRSCTLSHQPNSPSFPRDVSVCSTAWN